MFFEIKDLGLHPVEFAEKFEPGVIDLGTDYRQPSPDSYVLDYLVLAVMLFDQIRPPAALDRSGLAIVCP